MGIYIISGYIFNYLLPHFTKEMEFSYFCLIMEMVIILFISFIITLLIRKQIALRKVFLGDR